MDRTVQTQTDNNLPPEILLEAFSTFARMLIAGVRIVDANHDSDKTLRHIQKCLEAGARELDIAPGVIGKMFREIRNKKKEKKGEEMMKIEMAAKAFVRGRDQRILKLVGKYPHCSYGEMYYEVISPHEKDPQLLWIYASKGCSKEEHEKNPLSQEGIGCFLKPVRLLVKKVGEEAKRIVEPVGEPVDVTPADLKIAGWGLVKPEGVIKIELLTGELKTFLYEVSNNENTDRTKVDNAYAAVYAVGGTVIDYELLRGKLGKGIQVPTTVGWKAPEEGNSYIASQPGMYIIVLRGNKFKVDPRIINGGIKYNEKKFNNPEEYRRVIKLGQAPFATTSYKIVKAVGHTMDRNGGSSPVSHATIVKPDGDTTFYGTFVSCCSHELPAEQQVLLAKFNRALMSLLKNEHRQYDDEIVCALLFGECIDWSCTARYEDGVLEGHDKDYNQFRYEINDSLATLIDETKKVFVSQEGCFTGHEAFMARINKL